MSQMKSMEDHKKDFTKPQYSVPVPNPEFIALHCVIAHVLHMSGAGDVIDLAMHCFFPQGPPVKAMDTDSLAGLTIVRVASIGYYGSELLVMLKKGVFELYSD